MYDILCMIHAVYCTQLCLTRSMFGDLDARYLLLYPLYNVATEA